MRRVGFAPQWALVVTEWARQGLGQELSHVGIAAALPTHDNTSPRPPSFHLLLSRPRLLATARSIVVCVVFASAWENHFAGDRKMKTSGDERSEGREGSADMTLRSKTPTASRRLFHGSHSDNPSHSVCNTPLSGNLSTARSDLRGYVNVLRNGLRYQVRGTNGSVVISCDLEARLLAQVWACALRAAHHKPGDGHTRSCAHDSLPPHPPPPSLLSASLQTSQLAQERARADDLAQELSQRKEIYLLCSAQLSGIARGSRSAWLGIHRKDIYLLCSAYDTARLSNMRVRIAIMASTRNKH